VPSRYRREQVGTHPEHAEENGGCEVPLGEQQRDEYGEQDGIPDALLGVLAEPAVVQSLVFDLLVQGAVLQDDGPLRLRAHGRILEQTLGNLLLLHLGRIIFPVGLFAKGDGRL
jgi:hypothetical protein